MNTVRIVASGAITSIGVGAAQIDASLRAGLSRFHNGPWRQRDESVTMALVAEPNLAAALTTVAAVAAEPRSTLTPWAQRVAAMAGLALADTFGDNPPRSPVVLLLGTADARDDVVLPPAAALWPAIAAASGIAIDTARSQLFGRGRAAIFDALAAAGTLLDPQRGGIVVCGGVDSYADPTRVAAEHGRQRTLGAPFASDGRVLGEGAGMLVLSASPQHRGGLRLRAIGRHEDPGCRFGTAPATGEGLAEAIERAREGPWGRDASPPLRTVWAGLVGESFEAKSWGVACLRHRDVLVPETVIEHIADRIGDAGAALGALSFVDAHRRMIAGHRAGPAMVWAMSDHGPVGVGVVELDA